MSEVAVVVPTYWTWPRGEPRQPGTSGRAPHPRMDLPYRLPLGLESPVKDAIYDHPTPLDAPSTLPRLLESLARQEAKGFNVLVLTAAVNPQLEEVTETKVAELIAPFRAAYPIAQFTVSDLRLLRKRLQALRFSPLLVSLRGYSNVRNIQLITPHVLRAEVIIALDDDEAVGPDYLRIATEFVGEERPGIGGFYLDRQGEMLLPEGEPTGNLFLDKSAIMNEGTRAIQAIPGRLVLTPVVFGGNMVLHRALWERVSFDPWITRGEDVDYLINARLQGQDFFFDKELTITHLPPDTYGASPYSKLRQDVFRFIYEREKLLVARRYPELTVVTPESLAPYPGRFLREDVDRQALAALREAWPAEAEERPESVLADALDYARRSAPRYFEFARLWPRLLDVVGGDETLTRHLTGKFDGD